jgi:hypothetical protein
VGKKVASDLPKYSAWIGSGAKGARFMFPCPRFIALTVWVLNLFILVQWRIWFIKPIIEDAQTKQKLAFRNNADLSTLFSLLSLLMFNLSFLSLSFSLYPYSSLLFLPFSFCFIFISCLLYLSFFFYRTPLRDGTDRLSRNVG